MLAWQVEVFSYYYWCGGCHKRILPLIYISPILFLCPCPSASNYFVSILCLVHTQLCFSEILLKTETMWGSSEDEYWYKLRTNSMYKLLRDTLWSTKLYVSLCKNKDCCVIGEYDMYTNNCNTTSKETRSHWG
jgi:hypothetical protein